VGVKGGMLLASHTKYVGDGTAFGQFGPDVKIKVAKIPNLYQIQVWNYRKNRIWTL